MKFITPTSTSLVKGLLKRAFKSSISYTGYTRLVNLLNNVRYQVNQYYTDVFKKSSIAYDLNQCHIFFKPEDISKLKKLKSSCNWIVLAESEPEQAADSFPILKNITRILGEDNLKIILVEEHLDLLASLLSEDINAIPKLIALDKMSGRVQGVWGPCMETLTQLYAINHVSTSQTSVA